MRRHPDLRCGICHLALTEELTAEKEPLRCHGSPHLAEARLRTNYAIPMTPLPNPLGGLGCIYAEGPQANKVVRR